MHRKGHFTGGGGGQKTPGLSPPSGPAASEPGIPSGRDISRRVVPAFEEGDSASPSSFISVGQAVDAVVMRLANGLPRLKVRKVAPAGVGEGGRGDR